MNAPRLGVCSWSLAPEQPQDLIDVLLRLQINAVQLALGPLIQDPGAWSDGIDRIRAAGIEIVSGMLATVGEDYSTLDRIRETGGVRPDAVWPANRRLAADIARVAGDAGIPLVTFHAGFLPEDRTDPERATLLARLREVADLFGARDVSVAFETGQETAATLLDVLDELDHPRVGVNFDPANMILYAMGEPVEALRDLAPHVLQIHIKDATPTPTPGTWGTEVPAGRGAVDWARFFETARGLPRSVNYIIEREAGATREVDIAAARDLVHRHLQVETPS